MYLTSKQCEISHPTVSLEDEILRLGRSPLYLRESEKQVRCPRISKKEMKKGCKWILTAL